YFLRETLAITIDFLDRHRPEDRTEMAFENFSRFRAERFVGLSEELLGGGGYILYRRSDLDHRHAVRHHRNTLRGINLRSCDVQFVGKQRERHLPLDHWNDERSATADDLDTPSVIVEQHVFLSEGGTGDQHRLVRADGFVPRSDQHREE